MHDQKSLSQPVAVITGASRGLGAGLASALAKRGFRLGLCARSPIETADLEVNGLTDANVVTAELSVIDEGAVASFASQVVSELGAIDLWINNAGILKPISPTRRVSSAEMLHHLNVNVVGVLNGSKAFARHIRKRPEGEGSRRPVLINISSGAGRKPYAGWGPYCAAKAAVDRLTQVLAQEEAETGLLAYSVAPGVIDTDMQATIRAASKEDFPGVDRFLEMKRLGNFSTPEQVAEGLLKLTSHEPPIEQVLVDLRSLAGS